VKVAVIPARGGSKRIPRKNIRLFGGKPMIAHSIACALQSGLFERVLVSTEDDEIAAVAQNYGAEVPFRRPRELSDDHTDTTTVIAHAIDFLRTRGVEPSAVCCIYATAPLMRTRDLAQGLEVLVAGGWDFVFSATDFPSPIWRSFRKHGSGGLEMFFPEHIDTRSQDLPHALHDAAQFYWGTPEAWRSGLPIFGATSTVVVIPRWRVQDIDTEDDWRRAELIAAYLGSA
jgi:pseudaminic acid cytidylyltransferase